jgi:AmmeMemoRadiSam system protein A
VSTQPKHSGSNVSVDELARETIEAVRRAELGAGESAEACGRAAIAALAGLARRRGWTVELAGRDAADGGPGWEARVRRGAAAGRPEFGSAERRFLLELARASVRAAAAGRPVPEGGREGITAKLAEPKGCFVTLTAGGELRGCIGHILPQEPLWRAVIDNARSAAVRDTRFERVAPEEVDALEIEISVLTVPELLAFSSPGELLGRIEPNRDGVVLQIGSRRATFLPQVWEQFGGKEEFLDHLAMKAGCAAGAWREPGAQVSVYRVESFSEGAFGPERQEPPRTQMPQVNFTGGNGENGG